MPVLSTEVGALRRRSFLGARPGWRQGALFAVVAALLLYLVAVPIAYMLWHTLLPDGHPSLAAFRAAYSDVGLGRMVATSALFAAGSTLLAVTAGTLLAYLVARTDLPARPLVFAAAAAPLAIPGVLYAISWIFLAAPRSGALNRLLEPLFGPGALDVFSLGGMVFVEGLHLAPFVFLLMFAAFRSLDPDLEEAAFMSGAGLGTIFRRITVRIAAPAVSAACLITAIRALESFEVPALLGLPGGVWVFTSRIWQALEQYPPALGQAGALALSLLVLTVVFVLLHSRLTSGGKRFQTLRGRPQGSRPLPLGRWRWPALLLVSGYLLVSLALPVLMLLYVSAQRFYSGVSLSSFGRLTFRNYREILGSGPTRRAIENSLMLGAATATIVVLAAVIIAWLVLRSKMRGRWLLDALASLPLAVPGLVLGLALLTIYLRLPFGIYGTLWILLIAWITAALPYAVRYVSVSMGQIGQELEEAAHTSGATWWQSLRRILLPLLVPGLLAGWLSTLIVSLRQLASSVVLYAPGTQVLSVLIWEQYANGQLPQLAALGVVMVISLATLTALLYRLATRLGVVEA
ncbi:MAG: ABC transporter permease [Gaiellaceae bacterium]